MTKKNPESLATKVNEELRNNPLLAAFLLLNPVAALARLGFTLTASEARQFELSEMDEVLGQTLLKDNFQITEPQIIQSAQNEDLLTSPRLTVNDFDRDADLTLNIRAEVIRYWLKLFAKKNFIAQKFNGFPTADWWQMDAVGESMDVELTATGINLMVNFQCQLAIELDLESTEFKADRIKFPLQVEIQPAFVVANNQVYLSISKGQISLLNFPYRPTMAEAFSTALAKIIPYIPVATIPAQFSLPGDEPDASILLTGSQLDENGLALSFHIDENIEFEANLRIGAKKKKTNNAVAFLSKLWLGQETLWNYENFPAEKETQGASSGQAVMATIADFFGRNPFTLKPQEDSTTDGKAHYDGLELVGNFYDWYPPRMTLGETRVSGREDLIRTFTNLKFTTEEHNSDMLGDGGDAQKLLAEWISNTHLPVVVLLDLGALTVLENLATGENEAQPVNFAAHWGVVYAINDEGVKLASWGNEYFVPWDVFMNAWRCHFLPPPNNYYQIKVSD